MLLRRHYGKLAAWLVLVIAWWRGLRRSRTVATSTV
jgi:hypothetical protein